MGVLVPPSSSPRAQLFLLVMQPHWDTLATTLWLQG